MSDSKLNITDWALEDRPREKLMERGPMSLTNAELMAILVGSGSQDETAVDLMKRLLADCGGSLTALGELTLADLCRYKGIGPAKAVTIKAACELGRRRQGEPVEERPLMNSSALVFELMRREAQALDTEAFWALLLDTRCRLIKNLCVAKGGLQAVTVDVRVVLREALARGATRIIACHNHPSGSPSPSSQDDELTKKLAEACRTMQIPLIDHVIVGRSSYYSYADEGKL